MKLKKIASLALAGVMAVSMLAGCANKPATSEPTTEPTTDLAAAVAAALNEDADVKTKFVAVDDLSKAVEAVKVKFGTENYLKNITLANLADVADGVYTEQNFSNASVRKNINPQGATVTDKDIEKAVKEASESVTATYFWGPVATGISDTDAVVKVIVNEIKNFTDSGKVETSNTYTYADGHQARMQYTYGDAKLSVYSDVNAKGAPVYYVAYTITRTGTEQARNF